MPRKSEVRLTKRIIDSAPPNKLVWDAELPGFAVRVTNAGTKSFVIQYRTHDNKQGRMVIGGYPALTVDEARALARTHLGSVEHGKDPSAERRARRLAPTLSALADHYCGEYAVASALKPRTVRDARHVLDVHAIPTLGTRKIADVRPADIRRLHGQARASAGVYQANRLLAVLSKMFSLAVEQEVRASNPCRGIKKAPEDQRHRNFSEAEVARLLDACDRYPDQNAADAVRLLLFTGARLQEALKAEWSQFDLASGVWEKPSSHTKTKRIHRLELAGPSLELVRDMRERSPSGKFLFPGRDACFDPREPDRDLRRARSDLNRPWRHVIAVAGLSDAKRHDLRRTAASFMLDEDVSLTTIGKALGHTQAATTARYAQLRQSAQGAALKKAGDRMVRSRRPPPSARG